MNRYWLHFIWCIALLLFTACGGDDPTTEEPEEPEQEQPTPEPEPDPDPEPEPEPEPPTPPKNEQFPD